MFKDAKIPAKLANSPIDEALFEIRYDGDYPGEALYGILFDVFKDISAQKAEVLPVLQIPRQVRDIDPNLHYQPFYRVRNNNFIFSIGPHSIVFSSLKPYAGWTPWTKFFYQVIDKIKEKSIITHVERIGLRTFDILTGIKTLGKKQKRMRTVRFWTPFPPGRIHIFRMKISIHQFIVCRI